MSNILHTHLLWIMLVVVAGAAVHTIEVRGFEAYAVNVTAQIVQPEPEPEEFDGCTNGFWKNHADMWHIYTPEDLVGSTFVVPSELDELADDTLMEALRYGGGPEALGMARNLLRIGVAALLSATHPEVQYPHTEADVLAMVDNALASLDRDAMEEVKDALDTDNNGGCTVQSNNAQNSATHTTAPEQTDDNEEVAETEQAIQENDEQSDNEEETSDDGEVLGAETQVDEEEPVEPSPESETTPEPADDQPQPDQSESAEITPAPETSSEDSPAEESSNETDDTHIETEEDIQTTDPLSEEPAAPEQATSTTEQHTPSQEPDTDEEDASQEVDTKEEDVLEAEEETTEETSADTTGETNPTKDEEEEGEVDSAPSFLEVSTSN